MTCGNCAYFYTTDMDLSEGPYCHNDTCVCNGDCADCQNYDCPLCENEDA